MFPTAIFNQVNVVDSSNYKFSAIDYFNNRLYLGDENSCLFKYTVHDEQNRISLKLGPNLKIPQVKGKVLAIKHLTFTNKILVHIDKQLLLFEGENLLKTQEIIGPNAKDCEMFALDEDPRSGERIRLMVVKSDLKIAFFEFDREQFILRTDRSDSTKLQFKPAAVAWFGKNVFIGFEKRSYEVMDYDSKTFKEIEPLKGFSLQKHMIKIISEEETLFLGPTDFFIPINSTSCDKLDVNPIQAMPKIVGVSVLDPYIIMLGENKIQVYNKFHMKNRARLLQEDSFEASGSNNGKAITVTSDRVFFATQTKVHYLSPVPFEYQISKCLRAGKVDDAFMVFNQYVGDSDPEKQKKFDQLKMDAAWVYFKDLKFKDSEEIMRELNFDAHEFLALFKNISPKNIFENKAQITFSSLYQEASKRVSADSELKKDQNNTMKPVREFLGRILENRRKYFSDKNQKEYPEFITSEEFSPFADDIRSKRYMKLTTEEHLAIIDYALLNIYLDLQREDLLGTLLGKKLNCKDYFLELEALFNNEQKKPSDSILAKFYEQFGEYKKAIEIWSQALRQSEKNKVDRACDEIIRILTTYVSFFKETRERGVLFDNLVNVLRKNQSFARTFFIQIDLDQIPPSTIQKNLQEKLSDMPFLNEVFLEVLVKEKKISDDKFHTALASHYVKTMFEKRRKDVLSDPFPKGGQISPDENFVNDYRKKFNDFLQSPIAKYSPESVLSQIKDSWLFDEEIYLYGVTKQHQAALNKLLDSFKYDKAEKYCEEKQEKLLTKLFELYIKNYNQYNRNLETKPDDTQLVRKRDELKKVIHNFLKKYAGHSQLDPAEIVAKIPDDWDLGSDELGNESPVYSFLFYSLSHSLHSRRNAKVAKYLSELDALDTQYKLLKTQSAYVTLNNTRKCEICKKNIGRHTFVVYPNGVIVHQTCSQDKFTVCPITKQNFEKTFSG